MDWWEVCPAEYTRHEGSGKAGWLSNDLSYCKSIKEDTVLWKWPGWETVCCSFWHSSSSVAFPLSKSAARRGHFSSFTGNEWACIFSLLPRVPINNTLLHNRGEKATRRRVTFSGHFLTAPSLQMRRFHRRSHPLLIDKVLSGQNVRSCWCWTEPPES